jgi:hypothetical protein
MIDGRSARDSPAASPCTEYYKAIPIKAAAEPVFRGDGESLGIGFPLLDYKPLRS